MPMPLVMFATPLRLLSVFCSLVVFLSFCGFAVDEARSGSESSQAGIAGTTVPVPQDTSPASYASPTAAEERVRERADSGPRELLDDVDDIVIAPFAFVTDGSDSGWARRGVPAAIALAVYAFGLGFLARFATGRA